MGVCFSVCEPRRRPGTPTEPYFTSDPWDRKLPARENPDGVPKYYRDKVAREAINRRKKTRSKREAAEEEEEVLASVQPSGADAGPETPPKTTGKVLFGEVELDERPEAVA